VWGMWVFVGGLIGSVGGIVVVRLWVLFERVLLVVIWCY